MSDKCPEHPEDKKLYCFKCVDRIADSRYNQAIDDVLSTMDAQNDVKGYGTVKALRKKEMI
jgi:hypothetical protein